MNPPLRARRPRPGRNILRKGPEVPDEGVDMWHRGRRTWSARALAAAALLAAVGVAGAGGGPAAEAAPGRERAPGWQVLVSEDFEGTFPDGGWAVEGIFHWGKRDCRAHGGDYSAWALGASDIPPLSCGAPYPRSLISTMAYGPLDLSGYVAAELEYWYWTNTADDLDDLRVFVSGDEAGGTLVAEHSGDSGGWQQAVVDLQPWLGDDSVWLTFGFYTSLQKTSPEGGYLDDIVVRARAPLTAVFSSVAAHDGWVREAAEAAGVGGARDATSTCRVGDDASDRQFRSILDFDTRSLPDDAVVTSALLEVKWSSLVGTDWTATLGALLADMRRGPFNRVAALEVVDFEAPANLRGAGTFAAVPGSHWYRTQLGADALDRLNLTGRTQFRLRYARDDDDDRSADYIAFFCGDALARHRPVLRVTYELP